MKELLVTMRKNSTLYKGLCISLLLTCTFVLSCSSVNGCQRLTVNLDEVAFASHGDVSNLAFPPNKLCCSAQSFKQLAYEVAIDDHRRTKHDEVKFEEETNISLRDSISQNRKKSRVALRSSKKGKRYLLYLRYYGDSTSAAGFTRWIREKNNLDGKVYYDPVDVLFYVYVCQFSTLREVKKEQKILHQLTDYKDTKILKLKKRRLGNDDT